MLIGGGYETTLALTRVVRCHRDLTTDEEKGMAMGLGALKAAKRLVMTCLANVNTVLGIKPLPFDTPS